MDKTSRLTTYFAPPERATPEQIHQQMEVLARSPVVTGLLRAASGLLVVLNEQRQILALNEAFLRSLGISDAGTVLGLRLGESVACLHAHEQPAGCGTSRACATCGAAIAMVTTLATGKPEQCECIAAVRREGRTRDLCLAVRACVQEHEGERFILVFMQDVTASKRWSEVQRMLTRNVADTVGTLAECADRLSADPSAEGADRSDAKMLGMTASTLRCLAASLGEELAIQRLFLDDDLHAYTPSFQEIDVRALLSELTARLERVPEAAGKALSLHLPEGSLSCRTDRALLRRVLSAMIVNALEAAVVGDVIEVELHGGEGSCSFSVRNPQVIPDSVARRIFERHRSTKPGVGRGVGTFAMRLLGEDILRGTVDFSSRHGEGTVFRLTLPTSLPAPALVQA